MCHLLKNTEISLSFVTKDKLEAEFGPRFNMPAKWQWGHSRCTLKVALRHSYRVSQQCTDSAGYDSGARPRFRVVQREIRAEPSERQSGGYRSFLWAVSRPLNANRDGVIRNRGATVRHEQLKNETKKKNRPPPFRMSSNRHLRPLRNRLRTVRAKGPAGRARRYTPIKTDTPNRTNTSVMGERGLKNREGEKYEN